MDKIAQYAYELTFSLRDDGSFTQDDFNWTLAMLECDPQAAYGFIYDTLYGLTIGWTYNK